MKWAARVSISTIRRLADSQSWLEFRRIYSLWRRFSRETATKAPVIAQNLNRRNVARTKTHQLAAVRGSNVPCDRHMATVPAVRALCGTRYKVCCLRRLALGGFHGLAFNQLLTAQEFEHRLLAGVGLG